MARSDFITVSHKMDWDEILHRSVEAALRNPRGKFLGERLAIGRMHEVRNSGTDLFR